MTTKTMAQLIEQDSRPGAYGLPCQSAIVEHPKHGRIYLAQAYGGEGQIRGGAYRWSLVARLQPEDTLDSIRDGEWSPMATLRDAIEHGYDTDRPLLGWTELQISRLAEAVGL